MDIKIRETGEIKNLIIRDDNGIDYTIDFIDNTNGLYYDSNEYMMTEDEFNWWSDYIDDYVVATNLLQNYCEMNNIDIHDLYSDGRISYNDRVDEPVAIRAFLTEHKEER